jgi:hypothetical protein
MQAGFKENRQAVLAHYLSGGKMVDATGVEPANDNNQGITPGQLGTWKTRAS